MKQTTIIAIILGLLIVISAVQAVQLVGLKTKIASGQLSANSGSSSSTTPLASGSAKSPAAVPASVNNLPDMVGGC